MIDVVTSSDGLLNVIEGSFLFYADFSVSSVPPWSFL